MNVQKSVFIVNMVLSLGIGYGSGLISSYFDNHILFNIGIGVMIGIIWFVICFYFPIIPGFWNKFEIYSMLWRMARKLPGGVKKVHAAELAIMLKRIMQEDEMPKPFHIPAKDFVNLQTAATYFVQEEFFTVNTIEDDKEWRYLSGILEPYHASLKKLPTKIKKQRALVWERIEDVRQNEARYQIVNDTKAIGAKLLLVNKNDFKQIDDFSIYDDKVVIVGKTSALMGIVAKQDFAELGINMKALFKNLRKKDYIDKKGIIQDNFKDIKSHSDLVLDARYNNKRQQIYTILQKSVRDKHLTEKTMLDVLLIVNPGTPGESGPIGKYLKLKSDILDKNIK